MCKHPESVNFVLKQKIYHEIQIVVLDDVNDDKVTENTFLLTYPMYRSHPGRYFPHDNCVLI